MKYPDFEDAACKSLPTELFYPIDNLDGKSSPGYIDMKASIAICNTCPIVNECLDWGLHHESNGIWGGTSAVAREDIRKKRNIKLIDPMYMGN